MKPTPEGVRLSKDRFDMAVGMVGLAQVMGWVSDLASVAITNNEGGCRDGEGNERWLWQKIHDMRQLEMTLRKVEQKAKE